MKFNKEQFLSQWTCITWNRYYRFQYQHRKYGVNTAPPITVRTINKQKYAFAYFDGRVNFNTSNKASKDITEILNRIRIE